MLGTKLYKGKYTNKEYADVAVWCNANNATIEDKGEYYEVVEIPAPSLEELKKAKLQEVDTYTANKITGGFVSTCYNGENILYDTDTETQLTMTKARTNCRSEKFAINFPKGMPCRGYRKFIKDENENFIFDKNDKLIFLFTPEQIIAWDEDFSLHLAKCKGEGWEKQAQINACTTKEELEAIVLE